MSSIIYIGMDIHTTSYTLCAYTVENDTTFAIVKIDPDFKLILKYLKQIEKNVGHKCRFICGYEAGYLGYTLYHQLTAHGIECVIIAPTTMPAAKKKEIKTDRRDAMKISKCLAYNTYSAVYIPTEEDNAVKEYIRMRDDHKATLKRIQQQIIALCARHGKKYDGKTYWTQKHLTWLKSVDFGNALLQETFHEYLGLYFQASDKVEVFDKRIEELSHKEEYEEKVKKLSCFIGIRTHTAMSTIVEVGDFSRFKTAQQFSSYLGLVPGEKSSGDSQYRTGITKAGNSHLRKLLVEAAQCYSRGAIGYKSKVLKARQSGNDPKVIAYADRANERLKRKHFRLLLTSKRNIAVTAVARELACFIWGMMTDNIA